MAGFCFVTGGYDPSQVQINSSNNSIVFNVNGDAFLNTVGACVARNTILCDLVSQNSNTTNVTITKVTGDKYIQNFVNTPLQPFCNSIQ